MRRLRGALLVLATVFAVVLFAAPVPFAAGDAVRVFYEDDPLFQVEFPNGYVIERGGDLIIVASSDIYDMEKTGMTFFACNPDGSPIRTSSQTPPHTSTMDGNTVTHVFSNLATDIEMSFTDLVELETPLDIPNESAGTINNIFGDNILTTTAMLASMVLAAVMLTIMAMIIRMLDSIPVERSS